MKRLMVLVVLGILIASNVSADSCRCTPETAFILNTSSSSPREAILIGDSTKANPDNVAKYSIATSSDTLLLTGLYLMNTPNLDSYKLPYTKADDRVRKLVLFDQLGVPRAQSILIKGRVYFDLTTDPIFLPKNSNSTITIGVLTSDILNGTQTGHLIRLVGDPTRGIGFTGVNLEKATTREPVSPTAIIAARNGLTKDLRLAKTAGQFFSIRNTQPTFNVEGSTFAKLVNGPQIAYQFSITADAHADISWQAIKFNMNGTIGGQNISGAVSDGLTISTGADPVVYDAKLHYLGGPEIAGGNYVASYSYDSTMLDGEITITIINDLEEAIPKNTTRYYELWVTVRGADRTGDYVQAFIDSNVNRLKSQNYYIAHAEPDLVDGLDDNQLGLSSYSFLWSDRSGTPHRTWLNIPIEAEQDWTNERLVNIDYSTWLLIF